MDRPNSKPLSSNKENIKSEFKKIKCNFKFTFTRPLIRLTFKVGM